VPLTGSIFTVIGPAVNLVSRIEAVGKALKVPIIVSDDFARAYGKPLHPLGRHVLRGLAAPHELYSPVFATVRSQFTRKTRIRSSERFKVLGIFDTAALPLTALAHTALSQCLL
jgi:hypothetical protein